MLPHKEEIKTNIFRVCELALEAEIANDKPNDSDKLGTELGFCAPRGSIQHEHRVPETAYSDTPDDEEPNEQEKRVLRSMSNLCFWESS